MVTKEQLHELIAIDRLPRALTPAEEARAIELYTQLSPVQDTIYRAVLGYISPQVIA